MNKAFVLAQVLGLALLVTFGTCRAMAANEADVELPEAETFLELAAREMEAFHSEYKSYAKDWYRLGFDYAYPNYRTTDPDIYPRPADKNRWTPRGSHYTYVIAEASSDAFLIQAIGQDGKVAYELRQGMKAPKKVN